MQRRRCSDELSDRSRARLLVAEHVRVAPYELCVDRARRLLEVALPLLLEQQGEEVDLEQEIA